MNFKQWLAENTLQFGTESTEVVNLYLYDKIKISEIAERTGKTIPEIYRILRANHIAPNRLGKQHDAVHHYLGTGMPNSAIADLTGYSSRTVRRIASRKNNGN